MMSENMSNTKVKTLIVAAIIVVLALSSVSAIGLTTFAKSDNKKDWKKIVDEEQKVRMNKLGPKLAYQHLVSINHGVNYVDFLSIRKGNTTQLFALKIHNEGVPSIYVGMVNATKDNGNKTIEWVTGLLKTRGLVEYKDNNNDKIYHEKDNDTRLQWVNFAKLDWSLTTSKEIVDGVQGWIVNMTANDRGATYTIKTQIFNTGVRLKDGTPVAPTEAKIDFIFENFPWSAEDSRLSLVTTFGGQLGMGTVTHYDDSTEVVVERNAYAYFTWASTATVDGVLSSVTVYKRSDGQIRYVELNYAQGKNITHDPILGVVQGSIQDIPTYQAPTSTVPTAPSFPGVYLLATMVLVVIGLGVIIVAARKTMVEPKLKIIK